MEALNVQHAYSVQACHAKQNILPEEKFMREAKIMNLI
jgi:hypothetical protein